MNIRVGSILPLLQTATGRVFAAFLPGETVSPLLDAEMRALRPPQSWTRIQKLLDETRLHSLARVKGALVPGVHAIAAPLFDHKQRIVGVIGALGRSEELDVEYQGSVAKALLRTAAEISRRLGRPIAGAAAQKPKAC
jgi:DNA-binding IclR family transcriptional regulator